MQASTAWPPAVSTICTIRVRARSREAFVSSSKLFALSNRNTGLMSNRLLKKSIRVAGFSAALVLTPALGFLACTDLTEVPTSSIAPENFYKNQEEVIGGL